MVVLPFPESTWKGMMGVYLGNLLAERSGHSGSAKLGTCCMLCLDDFESETLRVRCQAQTSTKQEVPKPDPCPDAGLYDSIPFPPLQEQAIDYATDDLLWDSAFQQQILQGLVDLGKSVEDAFDGVPQDIEGVYSDGKFTVVQSRPQVL